MEKEPLLLNKIPGEPVEQPNICIPIQLERDTDAESDEKKEVVDTTEEEEDVVSNDQSDQQVNPNLQNLTSSILPDISLQQEKYTKIWEPIVSSKEHSSLKDQYHKISPKEMIFFDVADQERFRKEARINYETLNSRFSIEVVKRWDEKEMDRMFGKGLNPTSLITSLDSAKWFEKNLKNKEGVVLELGPGAGWSTVMLFNTLKQENSEGKTHLVSVDMSAHAIAASQTLLEYSNIPYITLSSPKELSSLSKWLGDTQEGKDFSGVILVLDKFENVISSVPDSFFSGVYSSHGASYLSELEYIKILDLLQNKLEPSGIFISDSLNPLYTNQLNKLLTISQILAPKLSQKILTKRGVKYIEKKGSKLKSNSKYFQGQDVTIFQGFNIESAYLILRWCNHLFKSTKIKRLLDTVKSLEVTMEVVEAYRDDVYPSYLLEGMVKENNFRYSKLDGRPSSFPIFMDTQGFRLEK